MALAKGKVNPLNVVGQRRLSYAPLHFTCIIIPEVHKFDRIDEWIYNNLNGRYSMSGIQTVSREKKLVVGAFKVGFEDPSELSMLSLACPFLTNN